MENKDSRPQLTPVDLDQVTGGTCEDVIVVNHDTLFRPQCPRCGSGFAHSIRKSFPFPDVEIDYKCDDCGHEFTLRIHLDQE